MMSLRHGPADLGRVLHPVDAAEVERLAAQHGLQVLWVRDEPDQLGRPGVSWTVVVLALPDDSTGALPLLRGIILNDRKSTTYKLALLRVLARIADGYAGMAEMEGDDYVRIPLGLVALFWLRAYKPLLARSLPQTGMKGLGFVGPEFRALSHVAPMEFRPGAVFVGEDAVNLRGALVRAASVIQTMPATYTTFADGRPIFPTERATPARLESRLELDAPTLWSFGVVRVPMHLWLAWRRLSVWIEPVLVSEWLAMIRSYASKQPAPFDTDAALSALSWGDPDRSTKMARDLAVARLDQGKPVYCVWSGRTLDEGTLDIDHCLPWSLWPCEGLWNLMPAHRAINQHQKRDLLVSAGALRRAEDRIIGWWDETYVADTAVQRRFWTEAQATLPLMDNAGETPSLDDVFAAVDLQRMRLRADQQLKEWDGVRA
ncbi:HNH endonuclease domain-containing protein [Benzoatithermus flavus]|uniref:HNH nuclease domain-containing protein n=1 Tax=Benzoatithermus flavus TaxID=3108223 RepID=A0ABU8XNM7_9PROT